MKTDQIDVFPPTVLGHLKEIQDAQKTRSLRQLWSDIRKTNLLDRIDFDLAGLVKPIPAANLDVRTHPYTHADRDVTPPNSLS